MSGYFGSPAADLEQLAGLPAPVIIGDLVLQGHEVPGRISIGGSQAVTVHKLLGGGRIVDTLGADPGIIAWHGLFVGPEAAARARVLDVMREQGFPRVLSFGDYTFTIVIIQFVYDYKDRGALISYRLRAEIVPDAGESLEASSSLSAALTDDLQVAIALLQTGVTSLATYSGLVSQSNAAWAVAMSSVLTTLGSSLQAASASVSVSVTGGNGAALSSLLTSMPTCGTTVEDAIAIAGSGSLDPTTTETAFTSGPSLAAATNQAAALAILVQAGGYINRVSANASTAGIQTPTPLIHA